MLRRSRTMFIFLRRPIWPDFSSARFSMVCPSHTHLHVRPSVLNWFVLGTLVMLFFRCLAALLNPVNRERGGIKWGLVCYTVVMFSCATVVVGTAQNIASVSFIDNRKFPGVGGSFPPGPIGYQAMTCSGTPGIAPSLGFLLNYWLADGLLVSCLFDPTPLLW